MITHSRGPKRSRAGAARVPDGCVAEFGAERGDEGLRDQRKGLRFRKSPKRAKESALNRVSGLCDFRKRVSRYSPRIVLHKLQLSKVQIGSLKRPSDTSRERNAERRPCVRCRAWAERSARPSLIQIKGSCPVSVSRTLVTVQPMKSTCPVANPEHCPSSQSPESQSHPLSKKIDGIRNRRQDGAVFLFERAHGRDALGRRRLPSDFSKKNRGKVRRVWKVRVGTGLDRWSRADRPRRISGGLRRDRINSSSIESFTKTNRRVSPRIPTVRFTRPIRTLVTVPNETRTRFASS